MDEAPAKKSLEKALAKERTEKASALRKYAWNELLRDIEPKKPLLKAAQMRPLRKTAKKEWESHCGSARNKAPQKSVEENPLRQSAQRTLIGETA